PWPTDHRGVLSTFAVTPAIPAPFVAPGSRRVFGGEQLHVRYRAAAGTGQSVKLVPRGGAPSAAVSSRAVGPPSARDGVATFPTGGLAPRAYDVILVSGGAVISRSPFWLYRPGTPTTLSPSERTSLVGEPITVRWRAAPGNRWDWLGVY